MHTSPYWAVFGEEYGRIAIYDELEAERMASTGEALLAGQVSPPVELED